MTEARLLIVGTVAIVVATFGIGIAGGDLAGWGFPGSQAVWGLGYVAAGALIVRSRSDQPVGRLIMWAGLISASVALAMQAGTSLGLPALFDAANTFGWMAIDVALIAAFIRFPDGDLFAPWARWFLWIALAAMTAAVGIWAFAPSNDPTWVESVPFAVFQADLAVAVLTIVVIQWRRGPVARRQTGWVLLGGGVAAVFGGLAAAIDGGDSGAFSFAAAVSTLVIPLSLVIAVTKYRLYEIDRIVSRTVTYGIVLGLMALVYVAVLLGLGSLLELGGDTEVALATLAAVAVSVPLLTRVRRWVDRRFFRSRYDSARVVARVADDLRTTVDLDEVERRTQAVIDEVLSPEDVTVWLADRTAS